MFQYRIKAICWSVAVLLVGTFAGTTAGDTFTVTGVVFEDIDGNGKLDAGDRGMSGIMVTDQRTVVTTDHAGRYSIEVPVDDPLPDTPYQYIQIVHPVHTHMAKGGFWRRLPRTAPGQTVTAHFPLAPVDHPAPDRFRFVMTTDPHVVHDIARLENLRALYGTALAQAIKPAFISNQGDLEDFRFRFQGIADVVEQCPFPVFSVPGNTDRMRYYEDALGPRHYAFEYGNWHFIHYEYATSDINWDWIKAHLAEAPADRRFVLFAHAGRVRTLWRRHNIGEMYGDRLMALIRGHNHRWEYHLTQDDSLHVWVVNNLPGSFLVVDMNLDGSGFDRSSAHKTTLESGEWRDPDTLAVNVAELNTKFPIDRISGRIEGEDVVDAEITLTEAATGRAVATTTPAEDGTYTFDTSPGVYLIRPAQEGTVFTPHTRRHSIRHKALEQADFTAATAPSRTISGTIEGAVPNGVNLKLEGDNEGMTVSEEGGGYAFPGLAEGAYRISVAAPEGYSVEPRQVQIVLGGEDIAGLSFTTTALPRHEIEAVARDGGTVSPNGTFRVPEGTTQPFIFTPDDGYRVSDVRVDGKSIGSMPHYALADITADRTIEVVFELVPVRTIRVTAGPGGRVSPDGTIAERQGDTLIFSVTCDPRHDLETITVDGENRGPRMNYRRFDEPGDYWPLNYVHEYHVDGDSEIRFSFTELPIKTTLVNFGERPVDDTFGLNTWVTSYRGRYDRGSTKGPGGVLAHNWRSHFSVSGSPRQFSEGQRIRLTWHNIHDEAVPLTPQLSFTHAYGVRGVATCKHFEQVWHDMPETIIQPGETVETELVISKETAGVYRHVSLRPGYEGPRRILVLDKIELVSPD